MSTKFLDDLEPGDKFVTGGITLSESEIIAFALTYDPQPFHLNAVVAAESIYGGLIASGFQVVSLTFRLFIQQGLLVESSMGSPGIDELRWFAPVRPGDTLQAEIEVLTVTPSKSKAGRPESVPPPSPPGASTGRNGSIRSSPPSSSSPGCR